MSVDELAPTRLISHIGDLVSTITVSTEASAGSIDVTYWGTMVLGLSMKAPIAAPQTMGDDIVKALCGEDYPALVAIWDNESDAIFDEP